jgi:heme/copper-type cytochrome/quinol oxidase subunit 1
MCAMSELPGGHAPARARVRWWVVAVGVLGVVLVAVGARLVVEPHTFGWFAYAPLAEGVQLSPSPFAYYRRGIACLAAGALLVGGVGGYWLGRRSAARR